jgi:hypothetical protein
MTAPAPRILMILVGMEAGRLCSPQIGSHTGDVYEVGSDRR